MELSAKKEPRARHFLPWKVWNTIPGGGFRKAPSVRYRQSVNFRFSPGAQVHPIECDAEKICRNEAELRSAKANHANDDAVHCGENPTFPATSTN
jgi:hypothetical protein